MGLFDNLAWGSWFYGLIAGAIGGGSSAVVSGVTVSLLDPKDYGIGSGKFFALVGTVFITNAAMSMFLYLKQTPLPAVKTVTTTATVEKLAPDVKVTTTVQETKFTPAPPKEPPA